MTGRIFLLLLSAAAACSGATRFLVVSGIGGEAEYEQRFSMWTADATKALQGGTLEARVDRLSGPSATRAAVRQALENAAREMTGTDAFGLLLIGHGTFDGADYKFNLPGPDITAQEIAALLDRIPAGRQLVVNMTSCGGGGLDALKRERRVVISATRSGTERNAPIFARYWVQALNDPAADLDKNGTVSALEAYRFADQKTTSFYETEKRIATEHAVLEDTGKGEPVRAPSAENGEGLMAAAFPLLRFGESGAASVSPAKRALIEKKADLEQRIDRLKYQKAAMPTEEYRKQLAALLLELARTQAEIDQ